MVILYSENQVKITDICHDIHLLSCVGSMCVDPFWFGEIMRHCRKYGNIARRLIRTLPELEDIRESDVRIAYLSSQEEKIKNHKIIFGECHKVSKSYDWCCPYDFYIVLYEPNIEEFTSEQLETLIRHELHHVGIEYSDAGLSYYVVPHDVEEFWDIIHDKGLDWSS